MTNEQLELLKEEVLLTLFEEKVRTMKNYSQVQIVCKNEVLKMHINRIFKKYNINDSYNDFISEYILHTWKAINKFEIKDSGSWEGIIAGTDTANIGRLIKYIKTTVGFNIYHYVNEGAKFTTAKDEDGNRHHLVIKMDTMSLDATNTDDETGSLMDLLTDENLILSINEQYEVTYFSKWFHEYKTGILTKSQLKFLDDLNKCKKVEGYTPNDVKEITGVPSNKVNARLARISNRIEKAWQKQKPVYKNRLEMLVENRIELLNGFIQITDEVEGYGQNMALTEWIVTHVDNEYVSELLFSNLSSAEGKQINQLYLGKKTGNLPATTLYKVYDIVEARIGYLEAFDTRVESIKPVMNEKLIQWKKEKQIRDTQKVTVYSADGSVKELQDFKPERTTKTKVVYVLPSGVQVDID